jgi:hypothetical protein
MDTAVRVAEGTQL